MSSICPIRGPALIHNENLFSKDHGTVHKAMINELLKLWLSLTAHFNQVIHIRTLIVHLVEAPYCGLITVRRKDGQRQERHHKVGEHIPCE